MSGADDLTRELEDKARRFLDEGDTARAYAHMGMLAEAHERADARKDAALAYFSLAGLARLLQKPGDALAHYRRALALFEGVGEESLVATCHERILAILVAAEVFDQVEEAATRYLAFATAAGTPAMRFTAAVDLYLAKVRLGKEDEAVALVERVSREALLGEAPSLWSRLRYLTRQSTDNEALVWSGAFEEETAARGDQHLLAYVYFERGADMARLGRERLAVGYLQRARAMAARAPDLLVYFHASVALALQYELRGSRYKVIETIMVTAGTLSQVMGEPIIRLFYEFASVFEQLWGVAAFDAVYREFLDESGLASHAASSGEDS